MRLKELEGFLQQVETFEEPKLHLEQFITTPHLASQMLFDIANNYEDIEEKSVCDLGVGTGMLSIGSSLLGADFVVGFDIDKDALKQAQKNIDKLEIENIELVNCDVTKLLRPDQKTSCLKHRFDTVIMNPPFGTKNQGVDVEFLKVARALCPNTIYSLHKTTTRNFFERKCASWGLKMEVINELRYNIPKVDNRNRALSKTAPEKDIFVDLIRFTLL